MQLTLHAVAHELLHCGFSCRAERCDVCMLNVVLLQMWPNVLEVSCSGLTYLHLHLSTAEIQAIREVLGALKIVAKQAQDLPNTPNLITAAS